MPATVPNSLLKQKPAASASEALLHAVYAHPDVETLRIHHDDVTLENGAGTSALHLAGTPGKHELVIAAATVEVVEPGRLLPYVGAADLDRLGIHTVADFERVLARRMMEIAKVKGDPASARLVGRARRILEDDATRSRFQHRIIEDPVGQSADLALVRALRVRMGKDQSDQPGPITLIEGKNDRLVLVKGLFPVHQRPGVYQPSYDRTYPTPYDRLVVVAPGKNPRTATSADLDRYGIRSPADFDTAAADALFQIAPEDIAPTSSWPR